MSCGPYITTQISLCTGWPTIQRPKLCDLHGVTREQIFKTETVLGSKYIQIFLALHMRFGKLIGEQNSQPKLKR
jgi:hypothetical protein